MNQLLIGWRQLPFEEFGVSMREILPSEVATAQLLKQHATKHSSVSKYYSINDPGVLGGFQNTSTGIIICYYSL